MAITIERTGQRVYLMGDTYAVRDQIKAMGGHWDGDRRAWWVGSAKATDAEQLIAGLNGASTATNAPKTKEDPSDIRLTGKGEYKGRTYYLGARTRDGSRVRCLTLPDANGDYLDFWADVNQVTVVKTYQPRERWGGYGRGQVKEYTTLGSIARFIAQQRRAESHGLPQCAACGKRGELVRDLEDGLPKCRACCDIPE